MSRFSHQVYWSRWRRRPTLGQVEEAAGEEAAVFAVAAAEEVFAVAAVEEFAPQAAEAFEAEGADQAEFARAAFRVARPSAACAEQDHQAPRFVGEALSVRHHFAAGLRAAERSILRLA